MNNKEAAERIIKKLDLYETPGADDTEPTIAQYECDIDIITAALDARDEELVAAARDVLRLIRNGISLRKDGLAFDADESIKKARNILNAALAEGVWEVRSTEDFRGARYYRVEHNERERAFADEWEKENKPDQNDVANIDYLLDETPAKDCFGTLPPPGDPHDIKVASMIIQWLGTNVGWHFLELAIKRLGLKVVKDVEGVKG